MTRSSEETILWNAATNKFIKSFLGYIYPSFSPDSRFLGLVKESADDITNKLLDLSDQKTYFTLQKQSYLEQAKGNCWITAWSPDSKTFVTSGANGSIWNAETGNLIIVFKSRLTHEFFVGYFPDESYSYHPNSKILLVSNDKELRFFSTTRNEQLLSLPEAERPAFWSPDGKYLLAKEKNKIALWQVVD